MAGLTSTLSNIQGSSNRPLFFVRLCSQVRELEGDRPRNKLVLIPRQSGYVTQWAWLILRQNQIGSSDGHAHNQPNNTYYIFSVIEPLALGRERFSTSQILTITIHTMNTIIHILNLTIHRLTRMRDRLVDINVNKFMRKLNKNNTYIEMRGM